MSQASAEGVIRQDLPQVTLSDIRGEERESDRGMSVWQRMKLSFTDMRSATRQLIGENPTEARLLFFVLLSDVIFFLNRGLALVISPGASAEEKLPLEIGLWLIAAFFLRTATLYMFSGVVAWVCRLFGGKGSWRDTRTGVFWASLVAAPIGVIGALIVAGFAHLEAYFPIFGEELLTLPAHLIGMVFFVYFVSASVAEAHRFKNTSPVFIAFSVLTVALLIAGIYLYAQFGS